jgi:penicillin-binding protein 1A
MGEELWRVNPFLACDPCEDDNEEALEESTETDLEALLAAELEQLNSETSNEHDALQDKPQEILSAERVIPAHNAYLVAEMLRTAARVNGSWNNKTYWQGTGWRARNILQRTDVGGKTGTTNDSRDTWFSGFAPGLVATAWVGFDDMSRQLGRASRNQNLVNMNPDKFNWIGNALIGSEDGAKAAQPAWIRFMEQALDGVEHHPLPIPDGLMRVRVDRTTGLLTNRTDHTTLFEYFMPGTEPTQYVLDNEVFDPTVLTEDPEEPDEIF